MTDEDAIAYTCDLDLYKGKTRYVIKNVPTDVKRLMLKWGYSEGYGSVDLIITEFTSSSSPSDKSIPWDEGVEIDM